MAVYLDNEAFETDEPTLGGAIEAARQRLGPTGRVIVEVRLEGRTLAGDEIDRLAGEAVGESAVMLLTADPRELALSTLEELAEELARARAEQKEAAELLSTDEAATALEHIRSALDIWQQAQLAVSYIARLLEMNLDDVSVDGDSLPAIVEDLAAKLVSVREQLESGDWVGLSDSFGYELDESAERWERMLGRLGERVRAGDAA